MKKFDVPQGIVFLLLSLSLAFGVGTGGDGFGDGFGIGIGGGVANAQSPGVPWTAIDDLGRPVVGPESAPAPRENKTVGLFYFLWLDPTTSIPRDPNRAQNDPGPYDLTKILAKDPEAVRRQDDSLLGTNGQMHFWGEPLFGYYDSRDPWVVRRHIQMISDAGVDVLIFDTTNAVTYPHVYLPLCDLLLKMKEEGAAVPQTTFMTNTQVGPTTQKLWDEFYSQEKYAPLFFQWEGKPLLLANPAEVPEALRDRFTYRTAYWPTFGMKNTRDSWHWVAAYPQPYSWSKDEKTPEEVNVSTAQNLARDEKGLPVWMSQETARGRSFVWGDRELVSAPNEGRNFAQQWSRAYELDPPFVMITGWNEWIAGRWKQGDRYIFVDQFNQEYSRDVEPTRGLHFDNYYLQTVDGIRKYKGVPRLPKAAPTKTISLDAGFDQWRDVEPTFRDYLNETEPRDFAGVGETSYRNASGRNDLVASKVVRDDENVYFYLETREPIRPELPNGLCLAIDVDRDLTTGWRGADLLIGRQYSDDGTARAETFNDAAKPEANGDRPWRTKKRLSGVRWALDGNRLQLAVPLELLRDGGENATISFKWFDNVPFRSFADLYEKGDVAPESSFFYRVDFDEKK